jgi:hypothetical protein
MKITSFAKIMAGVLISSLTMCSAIELNFNSTAIELKTFNDSSTFWLSIAQNTWNYFQLGIGVYASAGLPQSNTGYTGFTDWDTGLYIQVIICTNKLGLLNDTGLCVADERINNVIPN